MKIREKSVPGYERVLFGADEAAGYRGIIAIHSTALGRLWAARVIGVTRRKTMR
jgi:hypothetical protein